MKKQALLSVLLFTACSSPTPHSPEPVKLQPGYDSFLKERIAGDLKTLSSDEMEGRAPGTPGEERATRYIANAFRAAGLEPAGINGSFFQPVPLVGIDADPNMTLLFQNEDTKRGFAYSKEFMAWTKQEVEQVSASGELLFVGYGTVAPEFGWDDYKGVDCKGKILLMLVNDPPLADESKFGGKAMTYYGRWTYKFEIGAKVGAAAVFLIHKTERAGYPWEVVSGSWSGEQCDMNKANGGLGSVLPVQGWVTHEIGEELFRMSGMDLAEMEKKAAGADFTPVPLKATASIEIRSKLRRVESKNVVGILRGSHPEKRNEYVIYTAHWDHLGIGPEVKGDKIYNGAIDNSTGVAGIIAIARAFSALPVRPDRSIVFCAVTAEEQGLLGSKYYAENPLFPLHKTVANINIDGVNMLGRTKDLVVIGLGNSTLDSVIFDAAAEQGRVLVPDQEPEKGFFYRSDQFNFAKKGVPALYCEAGFDFVGRPKNWGKEQSDDYTANRYHKPQDEFDPNWNYEGMIDDLKLFLTVGYRVSQTAAIPEWRPGKEFKAIREESLRKAGR